MYTFTVHLMPIKAFMRLRDGCWIEDDASMAEGIVLNGAPRPADSAVLSIIRGKMERKLYNNWLEHLGTVGLVVARPLIRRTPPRP